MRNWHTTLSGIGAALFSFLTVLSILPYQLGEVATIIPVSWKPKLAIASLIATLILRTLNSIAQKDAHPAPPSGPEAAMGQRPPA